MSEFVRLNLVFPLGLEEVVADALIADPTLPGFTVLHAEGHGTDFAHASAKERVRGRVERRVLWMVIERERVNQVLTTLQQSINSIAVRWWTEPVLEVGRLA